MICLFIGRLANHTVLELVIDKDDLQNELQVEQIMFIGGGNQATTAVIYLWV